jgi:hypothetical protein
MKINPIEERSRDPLAIALDLHRTAAAFAFEVAKISARAGMQAGPHVSITLGISWQLEPGGDGVCHLAAF